MSVFLLDINVLIALAWPNHIHHPLARKWFHNRGKKAWATCAVTQIGFVRISSNPSIIPEAASPMDALDMLKQMARHPGHHFWMDELSLADPDFAFPGLLSGHRQVVDAYLLSLAARKGGKLATLDKGLLAMDANTKHLELIRSN